MPITPVNTFLNILDKLSNILRTEFGNTLPVYVGHDTKNVGTQYLRLDPDSSELVEYTNASEKREFTINMFYYAFQKKLEKRELENILRIVARIESLVHDNIQMTLSDNTTAYNTRIETTELDVLDDEDKYVVQFELKCLHLSNLG